MLFNVFASATGIEWFNTIDGMIIEWFNHGFGTQDGYVWWGNLVLIIASLIFATIFGGCLGYQREINGHAAGFRTHILISLGSALIMVLSIYGISNTGTRDPMRLAAAGVTGIGFLGAGSIIQNGFNVKGLTTAATIWVTMAIGMCCGSGYFVAAVLTTIIALLCLVTFRKLEIFASKKNCNVMLVVEEDVPVLAKLLDISEKLGITIKDISSSIVRQGTKTDKKYVRVVFKVASLNQEKINGYLDQLKLTFNPVELRVLN